MRFPEYVLNAIAQLRAGGFEAYAVGGCVRDTLLGNKPYDYDITTSAVPDEVLSVFDSYKIVKTGLKHGTVTVFMDGNPLEITTYRSEGVYSDMRRPDEVRFVGDVAEDLKRRDFTINAMAADESRIIDMFGGRDDLKSGLIRCVGNPDIRFNEDGLRIMRAIRFASKLNFKIEPLTERAIFDNKDNLHSVAAERIIKELDGVLAGSRCGEVIARYAEVIRVFLPELTLTAIQSVGRASNSRVRLALLFDGCDSSVMRRLKYDNKRISLVSALYSYKNLSADELSVGKAVSVLGEDVFSLLCEFVTARGGNGDALRIAGKSAVVCKISDLKISGADIKMRFGLSGKQIGNALAALQDAVISGDLKNLTSDIEEYIENHIDLF